MQKTIALGVFLGLLLGALAPMEAKASPELYTASKCQKCHAVSAYGISKSGAAAEAGEEEEEGGTKVPDLSNTGNFHDAAFFKEYLSKKTEHTVHAGSESTKKHKVKFKGSDDDLNKLADWLATLKKEPTAK